MNEQDILKIIEGHYDHIYQLKNSYVFGWESDYFGVTKNTGYAYEIEVKISVSDFKADFKNKVEKHRCLKMADKEIIVFPTKEKMIYGTTGEKEESTDRLGNKRINDIYGNIPQGYCPFLMKKNFVPNRMFYAVPEDLVEKVKDLVPKYAGLISISETFHNIKEVKSAPLLHKRKSFDLLKGILLDKFYWAYKSKCSELTLLKRDIALEKMYYEPEDFEEKLSNVQLSIF